MIPVSTDYVQQVYEKVREFRAKVRIQFSEDDLTQRDWLEFTLDKNVVQVMELAGSKNCKLKYVITPAEVRTWAEITTDNWPSDYDSAAFDDDNDILLISGTANNNFYQYIGYDIIGILTDYYGESLWQGRTTLQSKVEYARQIVVRMSAVWKGIGYSPPGNWKCGYVDGKEQSGSFDFTYRNVTHEGNYEGILTLTSFKQEGGNYISDPALLIDDDGFYHTMAYNEAGNNGTSNAYLKTNYVRLSIYTNIKSYEDDKIIRMNILEETSILSDSLPANELSLTMDNSNGEFNYMKYENMFKIIASKPRIWTDLGLVKSDETVEWIPCGVWILSEFKNDNSSKVVTLTANDFFAVLGETSYTPKGLTNLRDLAIDVLKIGGVPEKSISVDLNLAGYTVRNFPEILDCRTALQHIGIVSRAAVGQDRFGNVFIRRFLSIDEDTSYLNYPTQQPNLFGYPGSGNQLLNNTESGMKRIGIEQMYQVPTVALEKSIYQLKIKIYSTADGIEKIYTNTDIEGTNGQSFTIDNPLIDTIDLADKVAEWYMREVNYNAVYNVKWRQNPSLEATDLILVEDSFGAEKQSRIVRQEFNYQGYLEGTTETRGGV